MLININDLFNFTDKDELIGSITKMFSTNELIERLAKDEIELGMKWTNESIKRKKTEEGAEEFSREDIDYIKAILQDERHNQLIKESEGFINPESDNIFDFTVGFAVVKGNLDELMKRKEEIKKNFKNLLYYRGGH